MGRRAGRRGPRLQAGLGTQATGGLAAEVRRWPSRQLPYRDGGLVAPQRGHGAGRGGPRGRRRDTGQTGRRARGRRGAGTEAQGPMADAGQERAGTGGQFVLGEAPPRPGQLRPHAVQHVGRAPAPAWARARRAARLGAAGIRLLLAGRGGFFLVLTLLLLHLLFGQLLRHGPRAFGCSRRGHQRAFGADQQEPGRRGRRCPLDIAPGGAGAPDDSLYPEKGPPLQAEVVLRGEDDVGLSQANPGLGWRGGEGSPLPLSLWGDPVQPDLPGLESFRF